MTTCKRVLAAPARRCAWAGLLRAVIVMLTATVSTGMPSFDPPHHPEHLLVRFLPGTSEETRQLVHASVGAEELRKYRYVDCLVLVEVPAEDLEQACAQYLGDPNVMYAEPSYTVEGTATPDDPYFCGQWGLSNTSHNNLSCLGEYNLGTPGSDIRARRAWDLWQGDQEYLIAVIDSGVDLDHPDLAGNLWTNPHEVFGRQRGRMSRNL